MGNLIQKFNVNDFTKYNYDNCETLFKSGYQTIGRVVDIYDGDTFTVIIEFQKKYIKYPVRLYGIDTCEMKSKDKDSKELAYKARELLYNLITDDKLDDYKCKRTDIRQKLNDKIYLVRLDIIGLEKYGRLLAKVYKYNNTKQNFFSINFKNNEGEAFKEFSNILLKNNLAYIYDGKTKNPEKFVQFSKTLDF